MTIKPYHWDNPPFHWDNPGDNGGVPIWQGAKMAAVAQTSSTNTTLFPITLSSRQSGITITQLSDYWFMMPFVIPNSMIGKLDQFRLEYTNQLTSTHTRVAAWDGITGALIDSQQQAHSSATVAHVNFSAPLTSKYVIVGTCAGIPATPASQAVTYQGGLAANCIGLNLDVSTAEGKNVAAVLATKGTGDWEVPPSTLDFTTANQAVEGSVFMAGLIPDPLFCCLQQN